MDDRHNQSRQSVEPEAGDERDASPRSALQSGAILAPGTASGGGRFKLRRAHPAKNPDSVVTCREKSSASWHSVRKRGVRAVTPLAILEPSAGGTYMTKRPEHVAKAAKMISTQGQLGLTGMRWSQAGVLT